MTTAIAVKPLEWNDDDLPAAKCVFGHYVIHPRYKHAELLLGYGNSTCTSLGRVELDKAATVDEIKAAAQADYDSRILSALTPHGEEAAAPAPQHHVTGPPRWRVFEDITHGWWGIEEDILDGKTILYPKKMNREPLDGIVRAHNAALAATATEDGR